MTRIATEPIKRGMSQQKSAAAISRGAIYGYMFIGQPFFIWVSVSS